MRRSKKGDALRKFGLNFIGAVPWGTHFCQLYKTKQDLTDIMVPYFAEGLRNNEVCLWATSSPLDVKEAKTALRKAVPDLDMYIRKRQVEILPYPEDFLADGELNEKRIFQIIGEMEKNALEKGFEGLRVCGNPFWIDRRLWKSLIEYEAIMNNAITSHRIIALCAYPLEKCTGAEIVDVMKNHDGTLIIKDKEWHLVEDMVRRRKTEELYRNVIQTSIDSFLIKDIEGHFLDVNAAYCKLIGYSRGELLKMCVQDVEAEESSKQVLKHIQKIKRRGRDRFETRHRRKNGQVVDIEVSAKYMDDDDERIFVFAHDITRRKRNENAIKQSEARYRELANSITDPFFAMDSNLRYTYWNKASEALTGIKAKAAIGKHIFDVFSNDTATRRAVKVYKKVIRTKKPQLFVNEYLMGGRTVFFEIHAYPTKDGISVFSRDITERKKTERELVDSLEAAHRRQAEVSALLEASKSVLVNREFSEAARAIFGSCKGLLGASAGYVALLSEDGEKNEVLFLDSGGLRCNVDPSLPMPIRGLRAGAYSTGKVVHCNDFPNSEWANLMPEGHVALKNVLFAPLTIENKTVGIIGLANKPDIFTERDAQMASAFGEIASVALINSQMLEKLEENEKLLKAHSERLEEMVEEKTTQLKNAERLAAIGETAGMIGHDIRNPLQTIIGELYLSKDCLQSLPEHAAKQELADSMRVIEEQTFYIDKIVTDLQDYAKPLAPHIEEVDLESIVDSVLSTVDIPDNIEITYSVKARYPKLMIDSSYMKRILTNLVNNAVQAMPDGGTLTINAYYRDHQAFVSVEDTGGGIPEEAKNKIFKPLFTTKAKGQGFGLAVAKKLTDALNAAITFESEKGKGTKFIIQFPQNPKQNKT
jgi:PAS domain S-box-containing protein